MHKIFLRMAFLNSLLLSSGLVYADNGDLNQDVSYLYFLNSTSPANLAQVEGSYTPGQGAFEPIFNDPNHPLPLLLTPHTGAHATMTSLYGAFSFSVVYELIEISSNIKLPFTIYMNQGLCEVNDIPGRDPNGTSPDLPIKLKTNEWTYLIDVIQDTQTIPENVICQVNVTAQYNDDPQSINVKVANMSGAQGGTLANGLVTLGNKTTCTANDASGDCNKAVTFPIAPSQISHLFTFNADPTERDLEGGLFYPIINDPELPSSELYYVAVRLQDGEQVTDRCKAEVTPPMTGSIKYQAQAYQVGTDAENTCVVNVTRHVGLYEENNNQ